MLLLRDIPESRLAISSWAFAEAYYRSEFSLLDLPGAAAERGFRLVEMNDFMLPPPPYSRVVRPLFKLLPQVNAELWRYRQTTLRELKRRLTANEVACLCWTINSDFAGPAGTSLAQRLYWQRGLEAAILLAARKLRIILGGADGGQPAVHTVPQLSRFVRMALACFDGTLVLENHWGVSSDIDVMLAIFHDVRSRLSAAEQARFWLCLDPDNMHEMDRPAQWAKMAPWAGHVHLKGAPPPELMSLLLAADYDGYYCLETLPLSK